MEAIENAFMAKAVTPESFQEEGRSSHSSNFQLNLSRF
jgi:hypothetical protein